MPQCKGVAYVGTNDARPCPRPAHQNLPFCWHHGEQARDAVAALNADGPENPDFMLQHLSYRSRGFEQLTFRPPISRKAPPALRPRDGNASGLSLGRLDSLPLEVLYGIFSYLSIPDLRSFKATNSRGHLMVSSDTRYSRLSTIVTHAPGLIAALNNTGLLSTFTIGQIHNALTRSTCSICNSFAGYIFLPGLQRCCQRCAMYDADMWVNTFETAVHSYQIPRKAAEAMPRMLVSAKNYKVAKLGLGTRGFGNNTYLVSRAEARRLGNPNPSIILPDRDRLPPNLAVVCPSKAILGGQCCSTDSKNQMPLAVLELNSNNPLNHTVDRGYHCLGCAKAVCGRLLRKKSLDCRGCQTSSEQGGIDEPRSRDFFDLDVTLSCKVAVDRGKLYSRAAILAHIAVCSNVQDHLADLEIEKGRPPIEKTKLKRRGYA